MAAVYGDPFARRHRRPQPEPQAHQVRDYRMKSDGAVRLAAVQVERHARRRDMRVDEGEDPVLPHGQ